MQVRSKIKDSDDIRAAKINARAVIIGAIITATIGLVGALFGGILESNKAQIVINQTFYGMLDDSSEDITLEEIKQSYTNLQNDYNSAQNEIKKILKENEALKQNKTKLIEKNNNLMEDKENQLEQIRMLENEIDDINKNLSEAIEGIELVINSEELPGKYKAIMKNGEIMLSTKVLENYFNEEIVWDENKKTIYVGNSFPMQVQQVVMWNKPYEEVSNLSNFIADKEEKMIGFHISGFYIGISPKIYTISYLLNGKSKEVSGLFVFDTSYSSDNAKLTFKDENGNILRETELLNILCSQTPFNVPTNDCEKLIITFEFNTGGGSHSVSGKILDLANYTTEAE